RTSISGLNLWSAIRSDLSPTTKSRQTASAGGIRSEIHLPMYADHEPRRGEAVNLIGSENLSQLGDKIGAAKTRVPLANEWIARILAWQGHPAAAIARRIRVSDTTVRRWLKGQKHVHPATARDT
ncbi:MAG: hypothetical protein AB7S99_14305, partial [Pseudodonghicola sp.]